MLFDVNRAKRRNEVQECAGFNRELSALKVHLVEQTIEDRGTKICQCCQRGRVDPAGGNEPAAGDDYQPAIARALGKESGEIAEVAAQDLFGERYALLSGQLLEFG